MVMEPEVLSCISGDGDPLEDTALYSLSEEGQLEAFRHHGFWQCMDTQRDKLQLEALWESWRAPWKVWSG